MTRQNRKPYILYAILLLAVILGVYILLRRDTGIISPIPDSNSIKVIYVSPSK